MVGNAVGDVMTDRRVHGDAPTTRSAGPPTSWSTRRSTACPWSTTAAWSASSRGTTSIRHAGALACSTTDSAPWPRSTSRRASQHRLPRLAAARRHGAVRGGQGQRLRPRRRAGRPGGVARRGRRGWDRHGGRGRGAARSGLAAPLLIFGPLTGVELARASRRTPTSPLVAGVPRRGAAAPRPRARQVQLGHGQAGRRRVRRRRPGRRRRRRPFGPDEPFRHRRRRRSRLLRRSAPALHGARRRSQGELPGLTAHTANSAATMREPAAHFDMVRTGIAIYGLSPSATTPSPAGCGRRCA